MCIWLTLPRDLIIHPKPSLVQIMRQTIIWTNDGILLIEPSLTNFGEKFIEIIFLEIYKFSFNKKIENVVW